MYYRSKLTGNVYQLLEADRHFPEVWIATRVDGLRIKWRVPFENLELIERPQ